MGVVFESEIHPSLDLGCAVQKIVAGTMKMLQIQVYPATKKSRKKTLKKILFWDNIHLTVLMKTLFEGNHLFKK